MQVARSQGSREVAHQINYLKITQCSSDSLKVLRIRSLEVLALQVQVWILLHEILINTSKVELRMTGPLIPQEPTRNATSTTISRHQIAPSI
jgi:hypothetical protein